MMKVKILFDFELAEEYRPANGLVVDVVGENNHSFIVTHSSWDRTQIISKYDVKEVNVSKEEQLKATIDNLQESLNKTQKQLQLLKSPEVKSGQMWRWIDEPVDKFIVIQTCDKMCKILQHDGRIRSNSIEYIKSNSTLICNVFGRGDEV